MSTFMKKSNTSTGTGMMNTISIRTRPTFLLASPTAISTGMKLSRINTRIFPTFIIGTGINRRAIAA